MVRGPNTEEIYMLKSPMDVARKVSDWMVDYAEDAGRDSWVIGVSGGIDSAVSFRLAQMTGMDVFPVFLPKNGQQRLDLIPLVQDLLDGSGMELCTHRINDVVDFDEIPMFSPQESLRLAIGNFHARQRMALLYYYGEMHRALVLGTTNAAEAFIGYYTKWGDGAVDIEPLIGLLKSEVYQLGVALDVPKSIAESIPSANLWPGQTDEGELGFTYDDIDAMLSGGPGPDERAWSSIMDMRRRSEHKRTLIPGYHLSSTDVVPTFEIGGLCGCGERMYALLSGSVLLLAQDEPGVTRCHCGHIAPLRDLR